MLTLFLGLLLSVLAYYTFPLEIRMRPLGLIHILMILIRNFFFLTVLFIFYKCGLEIILYILLFLNSMLTYYIAFNAIKISLIASVFTSLLGSLEMMTAIILLNKSNVNTHILIILGSLIYLSFAVIEVAAYNFIYAGLYHSLI